MSVPPKIAADAPRKRTAPGTTPPAPPDAELVARHSDWVRSLARSLVRDPSRAEDLAQEALLAALAAPPQDAADGLRLRAWLGRVTHNLSHLALRRNRRRRWREECAARKEELVSTVDEVCRQSTLRCLKEAVRALDDPYRTAVELRYFDGLSVAQIAQRTDATDNAVRKRLWRARNRLRQNLEGLHNGERTAWLSSLALLPALASRFWRAPRVSRDPGSSASSLPALSGLAATAALVLSLGLVAELARREVRPSVDSSIVSGPEVAASLRPSREGFVHRSIPASGARTVVVGPETRPSVEPVVDPPVETDETGDQAPRVAGIPVKGRVLDLQGQALSGVELVDAADPGTTLVRSEVDGSFELYVASLPVRLDLGDESLALLRPEHVRPGEERWVRTLIAAPARYVGGVVRTSSGLSLAGARVELRFDERAFLDLDVPFELGEPGLAAATSAADGSFSLGRVPTAEGIDLVASHAGYETAYVPSLAADAALTIVLYEVPPADLAQTQLLRPRSSAGVRSRAEGTIDGFLVDRDGRPLPEWCVAAVERGERAREVRANEELGPLLMTDAATTADDGSFSLAGELGREYLLTAFDPQTLEALTAGPFPGGSHDVRMRLGRELQQRTLTASVQTTDGRPLADARVGVLIDLGGDALLVAATERYTHTDAEGRFSLPELSGDRLLVEVQHPETNRTWKAFGPSLGNGLEDGRSATIVVTERTYLQLSDATGDELSVLDSEGRPLRLRGPVAEGRRLGLSEGRTPVLGVEGEAASLVLYQNGSETERLPLRLTSGNVQRIRP